jgi:hypothetical protein
MDYQFNKPRDSNTNIVGFLVRDPAQRPVKR